MSSSDINAEWPGSSPLPQSQWPDIIPLPYLTTKVLTYVFKTSSNVEVFLKFLKEKYPLFPISVIRDDNGYTNITITSVSKLNNTESIYRTIY